MSKCRVIIADSELDYIFPIQRMFAEVFGDSINLEIISDEFFFRSLFSYPQEAAILIVSDRLYDRSLQRHGISHVFVMTEQEPPVSKDSDLVYLQKYVNSTKEVFAKVTAIGAQALSGTKKFRKKSQVVMVTSAAGGAGKTTVARGIAAALTKDYMKVLYINADYLQTFRFQMQDASVLMQKAVYAALMNPKADVYQQLRPALRQEVFSYLPAFKAPVISLGLDFSVFEKIVTAAQKSEEFDYIIVDSHMDFDIAKASLMNLADRVVIVAGQSKNAVQAANMLCASINGMNPEKYLVVCNRYDPALADYLERNKGALKFTVSEYIRQIADCEEVSVETLAKVEGIQNITRLLI